MISICPIWKPEKVQRELRNQDLIKEFDARLWGSLVDFITVYSKDDIRVTFKDGTEIRA